jgi:hypothetical protein
MKRLLLTSACALALSCALAAPAFAFSATIDGAYENNRLAAGGSSIHENGFDFNGAVNVDLPWSPMSFEVDLGDQGNGSFHNFDAGGSLVWNDPQFRLAFSVINNKNAGPTPAPVGHRDLLNIGLGGEWYFSDFISVGGHGGFITGDSSGGFGSAAVKVYPFPDLSIAGIWDYTGFKIAGTNIHEHDLGVKAEWEVFEDWPLTIQGGFKHEDINLHIHGNMFWVGAKIYFDGNWNPMPLIEHNRTGTLDLIGPTHPFLYDLL